MLMKKSNVQSYKRVVVTKNTTVKRAKQRVFPQKTPEKIVAKEKC
jgi:hypothetical protein